MQLGDNKLIFIGNFEFFESSSQANKCTQFFDKLKSSMKTEQLTQINPSIDITNQPYDRLLDNLNNWKKKDNQTLISTLNSLLKYKYSGIHELQKISAFVSIFHKDICQVNQKSIHDSDKIQVHPLVFDKIIQLKTKFKKLQKNGCFQGEKVIKSKIQEQKIKKKNLINVQVPVPENLFSQQKQIYHQNNLCKLYRSFVAYFPESHSDQILNSRLISFLQQLYRLLKSRYFYLKQKEYFEMEIQKLCIKLKKEKYVESKRKMLMGEIIVKDVAYNKLSAFENLSAKRKDEEQMIKILKESEIRFDDGELIHPQNQRQNNPQSGKQEEFENIDLELPQQNQI